MATTGQEACTISAAEPVGTTSTEALACNSSTIDSIVNGTDEEYTNRVGDPLRSLSSIYGEINDILSGAGGVPLGDGVYGVGLTYTSLNQYLTQNNIEYRVVDDSTLPYTTVNANASDDDNLTPFTGVSNSRLTLAVERLLGVDSSLFPKTITIPVADGDIVPSGTTHLQLPTSVVSISPVPTSNGIVSNLTNSGCIIGSEATTFVEISEHAASKGRSDPDSHPANSISRGVSSNVDADLTSVEDSVASTVSDVKELETGRAAKVGVNVTSSPNMSWGGKGVTILGDSITHGAFSIDIARNNWHSIVRRAFMIENEVSNYGFITAVPYIGTGSEQSQDLIPLTFISGFGGQSGADATNSMSGWWYRSVASGSTITVKVPTVQKQAAVVYEAATGNGSFSVSVNGNVVVPSVDTSVGDGGFFKGGIVSLADDGTGFSSVTVTTLDDNPVRISGFMYENETAGYQFNSFAQSGRRLRYVDNEVIDAAIIGASTFILALGHNDSFSSNDPEYMEEFTARIDRIIATANAQKVKVVVADFVWSQPLSNAVRSELKRCADSVAGATYIPFPDNLTVDGTILNGTQLVNNSQLFFDSSHPNIAGHKFIGETINKVLNLGVVTKSLGLKNSPIWNTVDLSAISSDVNNISDSYLQTCAWRLSGNSFDFRFSLWNNGSTILAGTYDLITNANMPEGVSFHTTQTFRADNSNDGTTDAVIQFREGNAGVRLIVTNPTFVIGSVSVPNNI